ncbi:thioredoxin family protein [Solibacillus sp. FSL R7-0682]|uniref:thioredoxin family protein n=1 Tax=Solibacillus sp. FSL R7-0682 TaxID=2921690 RepID=UPI0030F8D3F0
MEQWTKEVWEQQIQQHRKTALYIYTPMCGTCGVAKKMLEVIEQLLPDFPLGMTNINYMEQLAYELKIESVPCLIISEDGQITEKIYAFQSVPFLYEILKK